MSSWADSVVYWLIDYYLAATLLLVTVAVLARFVAQPARRMAIAWGGFVGLLLLVPLCAIPGRPHWNLVPRIIGPLATADAPQIQRQILQSPQARSAETAAKVAVAGDADRTNAPQTAARKNDHASPASDSRQAKVAGSLQPAAAEVSPRPALPLDPSAPKANSSEAKVSAVKEKIAAAPRAPAAASAASPGWRTQLKARFAGLDLHPVRLIVLLIFLVGCGLTGCRVWHGVMMVARLCRRASQAPGVVVAELQKILGSGDRCPLVLVSAIHPVPIATGAVHPTILLPSQFAEADRARDCRSVLAHEWAHIQNGDLWLLAIDRWLLPLLWAHPLYLWVRQTVRNDQELLADASAATHSSPVDYAEMLLHWARRLVAERQDFQMATALGVWERPSRLADRIAKLLHQGKRVELHCSRGWRVGSLTLLAALPILLSTATVRPAALPIVPPALEKAVSKNSVDQTGSVGTGSVGTGSVGTGSVGAGSIVAARIRHAQRATDVPKSAAETPVDWTKAAATELPLLAEIRRLGGHVRTDAFGPCRLATEVNMVYGFSEEGRRVENNHFTDESLRHIAGLRNLKTLALTGPQVTDAGMRQIAGLTQLERLCLWDAAALNADGFASVSAFSRLRHLEITNAPIDDAALERLGGLKSLEELSVQGSRLTERSIGTAARLPSLKKLVLDLGDRPVSAAALRELPSLGRLRQLGLQASTLTDDALVGLQELKSLRVLFLGDSRVTEAGINSLQESLPDLYVITSEHSYPSLVAGATAAAECEQSIAHSQTAVAAARKLAKRIGSGDEAAALQSFTGKGDVRRQAVQRQIAAVRSLPALENVEWNLAYADPSAAMAVSTEFTDGYGAERVLSCTLKCSDGQWKIAEIAATRSREGVEQEIRRFAGKHPSAHAAQGWLPLAATKE